MGIFFFSMYNKVSFMTILMQMICTKKCQHLNTLSMHLSLDRYKKIWGFKMFAFLAYFDAGGEE